MHTSKTGSKAFAGRHRVLVAGTGPAGLVAALALARTGLAITLAGPGPTATAKAPDERTTALFGGSVELLRHLGLWPELAGCVAPLTGLRLIDDTGALLRAPESLFHASEIGAGAFGYNVANRDLVAALWARMSATADIEHREAAVARLQIDPDGISAVFTEGPDWFGALVVGADGRNSLCRRAAGIAERRWSYPQVAIATRFTHSRPHGGVSTEFHRRAGPLTTVPMPGNQSSLVWVETPDEARRLTHLEPEAFSHALEDRLQGLLGSVGRVGPRAAFPLAGLSADPVARARTILVGEAAHVLPPIGAQGLNLGFRDAAWVAEIVGAAHRESRDIGGNDVLDAYIAARRLDVWSRGLAVDLLNRSLIADLLPLDLARGAGVVALGAIPVLRRRVMREGRSPGGAVPALLRPAVAAP